jgi:hypothetical protein
MASGKPTTNAGLKRLLAQKLSPQVLASLADAIIRDAMDPDAPPAWRTACLKAITEGALALPRMPEGKSTEEWTADAVQVVGEVAAEGGDLQAAKAMLEAEHLRQALLLKNRTSGEADKGQVVYVNLPGSNMEPKPQPKRVQNALHDLEEPATDPEIDLTGQGTPE